MLRAGIATGMVVALGLGSSGAAGGRSHVDPVLVSCSFCRAYEGAGIYTMRPDGTHFLLRLRGFHAARWSPDGKRLVLVGEPPRPGMWIAGLDGQGKKRLTIGQYDSSPTWSPDGRRIVFVHSRHGSTRIWMIGASGGGKHAVIRKDTGEQNDPDWSPRGDLIVFSNTRANYGELAGDLLVVRPDGAGLRRLGHAGILPRWSPDGTRLAYLTERAEDDQFDANVLTLRTNRVRRYAIRLNRTAPVWSPDGRTLLVSACLVSTDDCASDASRLRLRDGRLTVLRSFPVGGPADWRR